MQPTYAAIGHFCWPELASRDAAGSKAFYGHLFNWEPSDVPSAMGNYTIFKLHGLDVAATYQMGPQQKAPTRWNSYVAVESADKSAAKAEKLGGKVIMAPFDVEGIGRMAVIQDPGGALLCFWQSISHYGAGLFGKPNSLCWTELATRDPKKALAFYGGLFGWEGETKDEGPMTYTELWLEGVPLGGMLGMDPAWGDMPEQWTPYFAVGDCDATVKATEARGGSVLNPATDMPGIGRFAALRDPQGASFSVIKLEER